MTEGYAKVNEDTNLRTIRALRKEIRLLREQLRKWSSKGDIVTFLGDVSEGGEGGGGGSDGVGGGQGDEEAKVENKAGAATGSFAGEERQKKAKVRIVESLLDALETDQKLFEDINRPWNRKLIKTSESMDYFNPFSDINVMGYSLALGWSMDSFVAKLKRGRPSGEYNHYVSMDTQVLSMVLQKATNTTLSEFAEEHLWSKVGFERDATLLLDNEQDRRELAFGILSAPTRDWARLGWLYLNKGRSPSTGEAVVPEDWVDRSTTATEAHLQPGPNNNRSDYPSFGYGFQWWLCPDMQDPNRLSGDFMALGVYGIVNHFSPLFLVYIYGQSIYVSPKHGIVIAKNAAFDQYETLQDPHSHENLIETQALHAFAAIAETFQNA